MYVRQHKYGQTMRLPGLPLSEAWRKRLAARTKLPLPRWRKVLILSLSLVSVLVRGDTEPAGAFCVALAFAIIMYIAGYTSVALFCLYWAASIFVFTAAILALLFIGRK